MFSLAQKQKKMLTKKEFISSKESIFFYIISLYYIPFFKAEIVLGPAFFVSL
jgi:hypothetical protein